MPPTIEQARLLARHMEFLRYDITPDELTFEPIRLKRGSTPLPQLGAGWRLNHYQWLATSLPDQFIYLDNPRAADESCTFASPLLGLKIHQGPDKYGSWNTIGKILGTDFDQFVRIFMGSGLISTVSLSQIADEIEKIVSPVIDSDRQTLQQLRILEKLSQFLDRKVPAEHFGLNHYCTGEPTELSRLLDFPNSSCGTSACAVGWLPIAVPEHFCYEKAQIDNGQIYIKGGTSGTGKMFVRLDSIKKRLGLDEQRYQDFFFPGSYPSIRTGPREVAMRLRMYVNERLRTKYNLYSREWYPVSESPIPAPTNDQSRGILTLNGLMSRLKGK